MASLFSFISGVAQTTFEGGAVANVMSAPVGTAGAPAYAFTGFPTDGLYHPAASQLALSLGGTARLHLIEENGQPQLRLGILNSPNWWRLAGIRLDGGDYVAWSPGINEPHSSIDVKLERAEVGSLLIWDDVTPGASELQIYNDTTSGNEEYASIGFRQNADLLTIETEANGAGNVVDMALLGGNVGVGLTAPKSRLHVGGTKSVLILEEVAADPVLGDLTSDAAIAVYTKNDKLVFAYNNAGVMTFIKLDLDGADTTLAHDTTAP